MRKILVAMMLTLSLTGCGESRTPLTHALAAFKAGDHDDLLAAKSEAQDAVKTAIQPGADLCLMTMMDIEKYATVAVIEKLDQPDFFKMSEEARLAYALKLAGTHLVIEPGSFLSNAPLYRGVADHDNNTECAGEKDKMMGALASAGPQAQAADEARMTFLHDWMAELRTKYGSQFDDQMRTAVSSLDNAGYSAPWPAQIDFIP